MKIRLAVDVVFAINASTLPCLARTEVAEVRLAGVGRWDRREGCPRGA